MPNGLSSAPRIFPMITKVIFAELRKKGHLITSYIDDSLLVGRTLADCEQNIIETVQLSQRVGFIIHPDKSLLKPSRTITYLGFVMDSARMRVMLTPEEARKIFEYSEIVLDFDRCTIQQLSELIGMMVSSFPAVQFGSPHYRR